MKMDLKEESVSFGDDQIKNNEGGNTAASSHLSKKKS